MGETKMKIYLDNCSYNRPYDDQSQIKIALEAQAKLYIQQLIVEKKIDMVVSFFSRYENSQNPSISNRSSIASFFNNALEYIDNIRTSNIKKRAMALMPIGLKVKDALHLACAIESHCDCFITTDSDFKKYDNSEIEICNPIQFLDKI
jgi:predicted nucleic acid-binding protein